jgi:predicted ABC-type ATPase
VNFFNADDRAAEIHGGYHGIPVVVRQQVNREFEAFIDQHIHAGISFAFETTLRSSITFDQIASARTNGFEITMVYLGIDDLRINLDRIALRWELGFHAAPAEVLTAIHKNSLQNLRRACSQAFAGLFTLLLYDNTSTFVAPTLVCDVSLGSVSRAIDPLPRWVQDALAEAIPGS